MNPSLSENIQFMALYNYADKFIIQSDPKATGIKTNLIINRQTHEVQEINKQKAIPGDYNQKTMFSTFLGLLSILNKTFLVFVDTCQKKCSIQNKDIFQVNEIAFVDLEKEKTLPEDNEKLQKVHSYMSYMKNQLLKEGYYFSYEYELTLSRSFYAEGYPIQVKFAWNFNMSKSLFKLQQKMWFIPLIQGSIKFFKYFLQGKKVQYFLITRRSWKKGGTRYNARGLNTKGQVANFCETQQIIFINNYCFSHVQIRGSVPAFWKQSGIYAQVQFYKNHTQTKQASLKHFTKMNKLYKNVFCLNLLSKEKSGQVELTLYFQRLIKQFRLQFLRYEFYDFHFACKGQKFERSNLLINKLSPVNKYFKYYVEDIEEKKVINLQHGVMRTNCLDCLDRTNFVQSKIALDVLTTILIKCGLQLQNIFKKDSLVTAVDDISNTDPFLINLKNVWADNGDMISKHYTGTGSTHTNVTRTGKRDLKGIMDHGFKSLSRFYKQYMEDNFKQEVIDIMIGQHTQTINLTEFESRIKGIKQQNQSPQI